MKRFSVWMCPIILLLSCSGENTYTLETFYSNNNEKGDTAMVSDKDNISANSDSAAFVKARDKFNSLAAKPNGKHGTPVKFTLRNHDGVIVIAPGQDTILQDRNMYPNQKSPD